MSLSSVFAQEDLLECVIGHLPLQAVGRLGRCNHMCRTVVARSLPVLKKRMAEIFRYLHVKMHVRLPENHGTSHLPGVPRMGVHECTILKEGLKVDEDFPALLYCYLQEVPAERVSASRNFITEGDVLRILDWLQHLPPQRRVVLDLSTHKIPIQWDCRGRRFAGWVPATISAHPAVRSRRFHVGLNN